jgi:hypothetical protein
MKNPFASPPGTGRNLNNGRRSYNPSVKDSWNGMEGWEDEHTLEGPPSAEK